MPQALDTISMFGLQPAQFPEDARWTAGRFAPNQTLAAGTLLGKITASGLLSAYVDANADGTQTAVGILKFPIKTDANSRVFFITGATAAVETDTIHSHNTAPYFVSGVFDPADLTGSDAAGLVDLKASTMPSGFIRIP
jgi:hypothetical protein